MAWTAPRTWVALEVPTAALLNTHLRDNLLETAVAKVTTKGDLAVATGANALTRLAVATGVLTADPAATTGIRWSSTGKTASGAIAVNVDISNTLTAAANNDSLLQARIIGVFAKSTFTGIETYGLLIDATNETASGAGTIATAYGLYLTPPTIGTTNWLIYGSGGNSRLGGTSSTVFIGDTSNANMTAGVTVNSGTASNKEMIALKDSGLAHGVTSETETDTIFFIKNGVSGGGGVLIESFGSLAGATVEAAIQMIAVPTTEDTSKATTANGAMNIQGALKSGTGLGPMSANANLLCVQTGGYTTRFILDGDGDSHQDVGTAWTNFDDRDDVAALSLLSAHVTRADDPLRRNFTQWLEQDRAPLEAARIVTFNDDGHHFINWSRANMLVIGAVRQLGDKIQELRAELADSNAKLAALEMRLLPEG